MRAKFFAEGFLRFPFDPRQAAWAAAARPQARAAMTAPDHQHWWRCDDTWFAGVNVLENDCRGAVVGGPELAGPAWDFVAGELGFAGLPLDQAQVSVCRPGYPKPGAEESPAAHAFRRNRDGAHVDGLLPVGPERRRYPREYHAFILGLPLFEASADASPLVVWPGSHLIVRDALQQRLDGVDPADWAGEDVTESYHAARRRIFSECRRLELPARPGEAYLVHRLLLHGIAPWGMKAKAGPEGRVIAYFRPELPTPERWLAAP